MAYTKTEWTNGGTPAINATKLNKMEKGIYDAHHERHCCELMQVSGLPQTIPSDIATKTVSQQITGGDEEDIFNPDQPDRVVIKTPGVYMIYVLFGCEPATSGRVRVLLFVNGSGVILWMGKPPNSDYLYQSMCIPQILNAGDVVSIEIDQTTGADLECSHCTRFVKVSG